MPLADPGLNYSDIRQRLGAMDQTTRVYLENLSRAHFGLDLEDYSLKVGFVTMLDTLTGLARPGTTGQTRNAVDDLLGASDEERAAKIYAAEGAKARADAARAEAEQSRRLGEDLKWEMRYGQFAMPFDVSSLINTTVKRKGNLSMLLNLVYADKRFKKAFPGLLDKNGDLKMSIGEYNQTRDYAKSSFEAAGIKISDAQFGALMGKNLRPEQIAERAKIAGFIRGNADLLATVKAQVNEMNAARKAKGLAPLQGLNTMSDIAKYVTKQKTPELYSTYEGGVVAAAAKRAGIAVSGARARELGAGAPGLEDLGEATERYKTIADRIRTAGVELGAVGITQGDLETIEFGGKGQAALALRAEQALRNFEAGVKNELTGEELTLKGGRPATEQAAKAGA